MNECSLSGIFIIGGLALLNIPNSGTFTRTTCQERQTPANENLAYELGRRFDISSGEALGDDAKMCSYLGVVNVFGNDSGVV